MKITKRVLTIVLSIALVVGCIYYVAPKKTKAATDFAITTPTDGSLRAAGYIDIEWESAAGIKDVSSYDVFIDGSLVKNTTETKYEFYTTKVNYHKVWIRANFTDGTNRYCRTVRFGITKKGLAISSGMGGYVAKIDQMNIAWYYNWGTNPTNATRYKNLEYVPMVWGDKDAETIRNKVSNAINQGYKYILGFNEPDMGYDGGGCNMDTQVAINLWPNFTQYMDRIQVGSPAYAIWGANSKMLQFMAGVENNVDYVCLHCYPADWNGGKAMADWFLESVVDDAWNRYHKPIWITEYSTSGNGITQAGTSSFIQYLLPGLDERDYVERHSFFSFNSETFGGGLWSYTNGNLSKSGETYRDYGNPETDYVTGTEVNPRDDDDPGEEFGPYTDVPADDWGSFGVYGAFTGTWDGDNIARVAVDTNDSTHIKVRKADNNYNNQWLTQVRLQMPDLDPDAEYTYEWPITSKNYLGSVCSSDGTEGDKNRTSLNGGNQTLTGKTEVANGAVTVAVGMGQVDFSNTIEFHNPTVKDKDGNVVYPKETPTTQAPTQAPTVAPTAKPTAKPTTKKVTKPGKAKISKAKYKKKRKISLKLKKVKGAKGYHVRYSDSKKFDGYWDKYTKKTKITLKKLDKNSKYYIKVRAYKLVNKAKLYGKWSKKKKVKVKK